MNGRLIAIGDIHGCHQEFAELLDQLALTADDQLVLLGDLVNRGPDSARVIALARQHRALCVMGNHELRMLNHYRDPASYPLKNSDRETFSQLSIADLDYLATFPLTHFVPDLNTVFVHAGFLPNLPWQKQGAEIVTRIQVIDPEGRPRKRAESPDSPHWADLWNGPPIVVYGHTPRPEIYKRKWSLGLDTACVLGGHLTAYILPEKRFVQVKARRRYFSA